MAGVFSQLYVEKYIKIMTEKMCIIWGEMRENEAGDRDKEKDEECTQPKCRFQ